MTRKYRQVGDEPTITTTFTLNNTGTNPSTVTAHVISPLNATAAHAITASGNGIYYFKFYLALEGTYHWRVLGSGTVNAAVYGEIPVRNTPFN